jgi:hypothetical protein
MDGKINYRGQEYQVIEVMVVDNKIHVTGEIVSEDVNIIKLSGMSPKEACKALSDMFYRTKIEQGIMTKYSAKRSYGAANGGNNLEKLLVFGETIYDIYNVIIYVLSDDFWKTKMLSVNSLLEIMKSRKIRRYFYIKEQREMKLRNKETTESEKKRYSATLVLED